MTRGAGLSRLLNPATAWFPGITRLTRAWVTGQLRGAAWYGCYARLIAGYRPRREARPLCRSGGSRWPPPDRLLLVLFKLLELVDRATYPVNRDLKERGCVLSFGLVEKLVHLR